MIPTAANGPALGASISWHGRFVAFTSEATNLVAHDTNGHVDVFLRDRQRGTTIRVSVSTAGIQANGPAARPSVADGARRVMFDSLATNLVPGDTNRAQDVFVRGQIL